MFCPEQAVLDDAQIDLVKRTLQDPPVNEQRRQEVLSLVREVMESTHKTYMYHLPLPSRDPVYARYPLEDEDAGALAAAHRRYQEILGQPRNQMPAELRNEIIRNVPGILPVTLAEPKEAAR